MIAPEFRNTEAMALMAPAQAFISNNYGKYSVLISKENFHYDILLYALCCV